jgi:hypothetical protein
MKLPFPFIVEDGRVRAGEYASRAGDPFGAFVLRLGGATLRVIANSACRDSHWWEHVSVSLEDRAPTWDEMCVVKDLFWLDDECVVQYHPPRKQYVNFHPHCLHLWRPTRGGNELPMPPSMLVGPKI